MHASPTPFSQHCTNHDRHRPPFHTLPPRKDGEKTTARDTSGAAPVSNTAPYLYVDAVELGVPEQTPSSRSLPRGDFFPYASNLRFDRPTMIHGDVHHHYYKSSVLDEMKVKHVIAEAEFDSYNREYASRCHPGTQTRLLDELQERIKSDIRIIWLCGAAGFGKSTVMQSLAEILAPSVLCLSFFFSKTNRHDDPRKFFPTLAYRLATVNSEYRRYLEENFASDPDFLAKTLGEQFKRLFVNPIINRRLEAFPQCVVLLDGLEQVDGSLAQCRILSLIRDFVGSHRTPSFPIVWVIASRPELYLQTPFSRIEAKLPDDFWKFEMVSSIDSDKTEREVETSLQTILLKNWEFFTTNVPTHRRPEIELFIGICVYFIGIMCCCYLHIFKYASPVKQGAQGLCNCISRIRKVIYRLDCELAKRHAQLGLVGL